MTEREYPVLERPQKLSDQVTMHIRDMILSGQLQQGERLPAERDLADRFDVSRTVIREAVRSLIAQQLIEVFPGSGMVVSSPKASSVAESMSMLLRLNSHQDFYSSVHEIRQVLEVEIVGLAVQRATDEDIQELEIQLEELKNNNPHDLKKCAEADVEFHAALARATHNELFSIVLDSVVDIMLQLRIRAFLVPEVRQSAIQFHTLILQYVKARDENGARAAMREHLNTGYELIKPIADSDVQND